MLRAQGSHAANIVMNNEQFRKLMLANQQQSSKPKNGTSPSNKKRADGGSLGSRKRTSIPLAPRSVASDRIVSAPQRTDRDEAGLSQKRVKTSAPRGVRLTEGYVDRAQTRQEQLEDDRETRLRALEESYKAEKIDVQTYEKLRFEIAGGDLESTHLVKGLDFKLLGRIRRGENVYDKAKAETRDEATPDEVDENVDEALEALESQEVHAIERAREEKKKGQLSTVQTGKKRTRDQILADLKAARATTKAQAEPSLGDRFRKIGTTQKLGTRVERDRKGREVLIIVDADGHEKRKVRKLKPGEELQEEPRSELHMLDKNAKPLGMEIPDEYKKKREPTPEADVPVDIFDDVGDDYDPLAGMDDSGSNSEDSFEDLSQLNEDRPKSKYDESAETPPLVKPAIGPGNYFKNSATKLLSEEAPRSGPSMSDAAIMAAIKKAATLRRIETEEDEESRKANAEAEEKRNKLLQMAARDDDDLDMGFGTSRFEDEEDFEDQKLSSWGRDNDDEGGSSRRPQRKRGPKKRKGDVNSAADVLRVMEQRKES
ncbi:RED-lik [Moelleriella libera RCEF 2490]|uniref:RED-lik n=1 Tax=Moelleriella libera RCEF 2490 TaxID=1081109 RepID=A0A168EGU6_9HYPO|nr:RED-lik [Moelleriella libera RCEF 2490]